MRVKQRARSKAEKLEREIVILAVTERLLRQSGYHEMTMQAVADGSGIAKGTVYLYFTSREELILKVYEGLFDRWIDQLGSCKPKPSGFDGFCRDFAQAYANDPLFIKLTGIVPTVLELHIEHAVYVKAKRAMSRRLKKLAGVICLRLDISQKTSQKLAWGLMTIAAGAVQLTLKRDNSLFNFPDDVAGFMRLANFETVFLNAAFSLQPDI